MSACIAGLGYRFRQPALLRQAMIHSSWAAEQGGASDHNERLEFLGDAVVDLVVGALLYERHAGMREGDLSRRRAALVNEAHLARLAVVIGLDRFVLLGRGEEQSGGQAKPSILAGAFEAMVGAVYLDGGYGAALELLHPLFEPWITDPSVPGQSDSKSALQEVLQQRYGEGPLYRLEEEEGPAHDRRFSMAVLFRGQVLGRGTARRKKEAERKAAAAALRALEDRAGSSPTAPI